MMVHTGATNNMKKKSIIAIVLRASTQVAFIFMSLYSGKRIHGFVWDELTVDKSVIERVEELACAENQPSHVDNYPLFKWTPGVAIEDDVQVNDSVFEEIENVEKVQELHENEHEDLIEEMGEDEQNMAENYVTDDNSMSDDDDDTGSNSGLSTIDEFIEEFEQKVDDLIEDINASRYEDQNVENEP